MDFRYPNTLSFFAADIIGDRIWCSNLNFNGLYTYDLVNKNVDYIGRFPNHNKRDVGLHSMAIATGNSILFCPFFSETIDVYDFNKGFKSCEINSWKLKKTNATFTCAIDGYVWGQSLYLVPRFVGMPFIIYSIEDNSIIDEFMPESILKNCGQNDSDLTVGVCCYNRMIYVSLFGTNNLVVVDMGSKEENCIGVNEVCKIEGAIYVDNDLIVINADKSIYFFDKSFNLIHRDFGCVSPIEKRIIRIKRLKDRIIAIPEWFGSLKIYDIVDLKNKMEVAPDMNESDIYLRKGEISNWRHSGTALVWEDNLFLDPVSTNKMIAINAKSLSLEYHSLIAPEKSMPPRNFKYKQRETEEQDLQEFILYLVEGI